MPLFYSYTTSYQPGYFASLTNVGEALLSLSAISGEAKTPIRQELRGTEATRRLRREHATVPEAKPCEVRCGNLSQSRAEMEAAAAEGGGVGRDIPGKVK